MNAKAMIGLTAAAVTCVVGLVKLTSSHQKPEESKIDAEALMNLMNSDLDDEPGDGSAETDVQVPEQNEPVQDIPEQACETTLEQERAPMMLAVVKEPAAAVREEKTEKGGAGFRKPDFSYDAMRDFVVTVHDEVKDEGSD